MDPEIAKEVAALQRLSFAVLRARYAELFHEPTRADNRSWLVRRIARNSSGAQCGAFPFFSPLANVVPDRTGRARPASGSSWARA